MFVDDDLSPHTIPDIDTHIDDNQDSIDIHDLETQTISLLESNNHSNSDENILIVMINRLESLYHEWDDLNACFTSDDSKIDQKLQEIGESMKYKCHLYQQMILERLTSLCSNQIDQNIDSLRFS